jgi:hypothetical protein
MVAQLSIGVLSRERPFDGATLVVAGALPRGYFLPEDFAIGQSSVQALAREDANLNLGHVQPASVVRAKS